MSDDDTLIVPSMFIDALEKSWRRVKSLEDTLGVIASQHSGEIGSTKLSDCMASMARIGLKEEEV